MGIGGRCLDTTLFAKRRHADKRNIAEGMADILADLIHLFGDDRCATRAIHDKSRPNRTRIDMPQYPRYHSTSLIDEVIGTTAHEINMRSNGNLRIKLDRLILGIDAVRMREPDQVFVGHFVVRSHHRSNRIEPRRSRQIAASSYLDVKNRIRPFVIDGGGWSIVDSFNRAQIRRRHDSMFLSRQITRLVNGTNESIAINDGQEYATSTRLFVEKHKRFR